MKKIVIEVPKHVPVGNWSLGRNFLPLVNRAHQNYNYIIVRKCDYLRFPNTAADVRKEVRRAISRIEGAVIVDEIPNV